MRGFLYSGLSVERELVMQITLAPCLGVQRVAPVQEKGWGATSIISEFIDKLMFTFFITNRDKFIRISYILKHGGDMYNQKYSIYALPFSMDLV